MSTKRILISNVFGRYNLGDLALYNELLSKLDAHEVSSVIRFPTGQDGVTELVPIGKEMSSNPLIKAAKQIKDHLLAYLYLKKLRFVKAFLSKQKVETLEAIASCDLMISCPGGFLEDSNKSYYVSIFQLLFGVWAGKEVVIAPQSIGPIKSNFGRKVLRYTLRRCTQVFVREDISVAFSTNVLQLTNFQYSPDIILNSKTLLPNSGLANTPKPDVLYATVVNWNFPHTPNPQELRQNYIDELVKTYTYLNEKYGKRIIILNQVDSDLAMADDIQAIIPDIVSIDREKHSPQMMVDKIANTELFIGTRFHSCIFSFLAQVPFIAVSYLPKTTGMLSALGIEGRHVDINQVSFEALKAMAEEILNSEPAATAAEFATIKDRIERDDVFSEFLVNKLSVD